jgi:hypothetical protein
MDGPTEAADKCTTGIRLRAPVAKIFKTAAP